MEQNIFDVADDISFPWLPAYAEATEANAGHGNGNASRMLETIVEETSDDDDKDQRCGSTESEEEDDNEDEEQEQQQQQQPLSWSQYDHVWSSGGSDAESVIRVETPSDQDTMSERDFICPPKRRKQESFGDGGDSPFLPSELSIYGRTIVRPRIVCELATNDSNGLETHEYFMKRHNEPRLRFDEIGHDLFTDSDSLSYASLSRSSSLIQFESLERQLQSESAAHQHPLSGSSPSLYSTESSSHVTTSAGGDATTNTTTRGGGPTSGGEVSTSAATATLSTFYGGPPGRGGKSAGTGNGSQQSGSNLLTTSNLIQKSIGQSTALNISDSELYSTSSSVSSTSSSSGSSGPASCPESNASSTGSSGYRYASDECGGHRGTVGVSGGERTPDDRVESSSSPDDTGDTEEELLSASVRESTRGSSRWRRHPGPPGHRSKNSIDSLSEDSGYCDLRLVKSKSLTNFGSAENVSFLLSCGSSQLMPPVVSSLTQHHHHQYQQHQQQQPLSMDYIGFTVPASSVVPEPTPSARHHRLSTVCDVDEEDDGEGDLHHHHYGHHSYGQHATNDAGCISAGTKTIDWPNEQPNGVATKGVVATISPNIEPASTDEGGARWSNTHNGTKIEHDLCKQRPSAVASSPQCSTTRLTPPTPPSSDDPAESSPSCGSSSSVESLSRTSPVTARSERRSKNSASHSVRRPQAATGLSLSAPDLLLLYCGLAGGGSGGAGQRHHRQRRHRGPRASSPSSSSSVTGGVASGRGALYDPISFTVSSVPECLYLYGARRYNSDDEDEDRNGHFGSPPPLPDASVASQNVNLYDLLGRNRASEVSGGKCLPKSVTFCAGSPSVVKPRQNIRASYANLTALNYSDDEDEEDATTGRLIAGVGHEYFLSGRNTFRTSSGTRLGGRSTASAAPRTPLRPIECGTTVPVRVGGVGCLDMDRERAREVVDARLQEAEDVDGDDDDEESRIFPLDRDEKNVFNSLLEELSAHFDRNLSIINDQAEAYEPIAAFLHEQRATTTTVPTRRSPTAVPPPPPPPVRAAPMTSPPPPPPAPQAPPRRTQIKTNPHVAVTTNNQQQQPGLIGRRTFDQDPTNLVTCYAASLERCTFDPTESSSQLNLFSAGSRSSGLNATSLHPSRAGGAAGGPPSTVNDRYSSYSVKREFVASTPNLNYYGADAEQHDRPGGRGTGDETEDHRHNSLRNVSAAAFGRSTGILATASTSLSKCGLSKGVSFCPIVSEIIWKSNSGSDLEPDDDDNASIISNQDFEIDIDDDEFEPDDYDHAQLITHTNTLINANSVEYGLEQIPSTAGSGGEGGGEISVTPRSVTEVTRSDSYFPDNFGDADERSVPVHHQLQPQSQQHPISSYKNNSKSDSALSSVGGGDRGGGTKMMAMANGEGGGGGASDDERAMRSVMMSTTASEEPGRNGGATLLASQAALMASEASATGHYNNGHGNNTNSSLIRNFKNAKADKKSKTFLSRISSGFRFSFRNKSKKALNNNNNNKETTFGVTTPATNGVNGASGGANYNNNLVSNKVRDGRVGAPGSTTASRGSKGGGGGGNDSATADFIYIPLKDPTRHRGASDETSLRQMNTLGVTVDDSFTGAEDEPDDCEIAVTRPAGSSSYYRSDSSTALNGSDGGHWPPPNTTNRGGANHVLSSKPPLPKQPPRVVGVSAKRSSTSPASQKHGHAQQQHLRASSTPPRELDHDEPDSSSSSSYYRRSPTQHQQSFFSGSESVEGTHPSAASVSLRVTAPHYGDYSEDNNGGGHRYYRYNDYDEDDEEDDVDRHSAIMGSEQKIGLIETNLDTHETIISGKTRSLMELGGGSHHYRHPAQHRQQLQVHDPTASAANRRTIGGGGGAGTGAGTASGMMKDNHRQTVGSERTGGEPGQRPHKSMEFLLDKENQRNVLPPENELQKSHETGTNLSEHQLRVQASLQRLNIPDWYKQYSGKDGATSSVANTTAPASVMGAGGTTATGTGTAGGGGLLRKRNSDVGRWTGLSSKTTSLSSLGSHRSDRSPVMLSPSAHSHHGQTGFSRWSTSHLNSNQTSPSVSTRGSFTRGGLNASAMSGYSSGSNATTGAGPGYGAGSTIRNSFRQPYLGWRSQEKLSQPRTPAERLASSLLQQQQQQHHGSGKHKEQQQQQQQEEQQHTISNKHQHQRPTKDESVVTPEIQSSIIEVTSAIVHYVNDQTNRHSRSRSTSPSQRCWLESSFVGTRPLDSPQTPMIENSSVLGSTHHSQQQHHHQHHHHHPTQQTTAGDHYRFNAGRMNGAEGTGMAAAAAAAAVPTFSLPTEHQTSPGSATLEDVLASLLGLPADSHRSSGMNLGQQ
ncbi:uncharacterized protein LOC126580900 isoform X4 [Anopheles aquasalis]|uniref:uncharacterized protein LOC126580900 isoform X4 n=1 Tax=Anopheles aquasalis TaxID=42839 RepID=UPI00215B195C|nr:uncharacterized protein LOC126580900 isoform X4 [Anopheles aquasalis]